MRAARDPDGLRSAIAGAPHASRLTAFAAVAILLTGCSGTGPAPSGGAGQTSGPSQHAGMPDLGLAHVTTETANARGAEIGRAGGTITATSSNGVTYSLTIPEGALATPTEIGLYPVTSVSTLPSGASFVAGAQFSPDGLHLLVPASLAITLPSGTDTTGGTGVAWAGDGQDVGPWLADPGSSSTVLPILHFSGAGVASGDLVPLAPLTCTSVGDMIELVTPLDQTAADYTQDLRLCWEGLVQPALLKSTAEASQGIGADPQPPIEDYAMWLKAIDHAAAELGNPSFTVSPQLDDSKAIAGQFLRSWYDAWNDLCVADAPSSSATAIAEAVTAMDFGRLARQWGVATAGARLDIETILDDLCVQVVIEPDRSYTASQPGSTGKVKLTAGYRVADGPTVHDGSIDVTVSTSADFFEAGTDANGAYEQDIAWPSGVDPIQIDLLASLVVAGSTTDIARFDRITKSSKKLRIAYLAQEVDRGPLALYVMDDDGGNAHKVADLGGGASGLSSINGDGSLFAVAVTMTGGTRQIVAFATGAGSGPSGPIGGTDGGWMPAYDPKGSRLAFDSGGSIVVVDSTGNATPIGATGSQPAWSSTGQVAYVGPGGIHVVNPDGTGDHVIVTNGSQPAWSPDGSQLVFVRAFPASPTPVNQLMVINADGSAERQLTAGTGSSTTPAWSPDGTRIAFMNQDGVSREIWVIGVDGSGAEMLTSGPLAHAIPQWMP